MGIILIGVPGRFSLGTRQGTSFTGAGGNVCIHSPVWVHVSGEISWLREARGRFWKAGEEHIQTQTADLTYEAGPRVGGVDPPVGPSLGPPALCSYLPTADISDFFFKCTLSEPMSPAMHKAVCAARLAV